MGVKNVEAFRKSMIGALQMQMRCDPSTVDGLTPEQMAALHVFGHKVAAAGYRLYEIIEKDKADPLIRAAVDRVIAEMKTP